MTFGRSLSSRVSEIVGCAWLSIYLLCRQCIVSSFWSIIISHFDERSMLWSHPHHHLTSWRFEWLIGEILHPVKLSRWPPPPSISIHPYQLLVVSTVSWRLPWDCDNPHSHPAECWRIYERLKFPTTWCWITVTNCQRILSLPDIWHWGYFIV